MYWTYLYGKTQILTLELTSNDLKKLSEGYCDLILEDFSVLLVRILII
jgi:hypothetical protein